MARDRPISGRQKGKKSREPAEMGWEKCGGTRFLKEAGFPRTPSGKNFYMVGCGSQNIAGTVTRVLSPLAQDAWC